MPTVTCNKCNWVSFAVTRAYAEAEVKSFNIYYESLPAEQKALFGRPSNISDYQCMFCNGTSFRPAQPGDCPDGCTLSPVICDELATA